MQREEFRLANIFKKVGSQEEQLKAINKKQRNFNAAFKTRRNQIAAADNARRLEANQTEENRQARISKIKENLRKKRVVIPNVNIFDPREVQSNIDETTKEIANIEELIEKKKKELSQTPNNDTRHMNIKDSIAFMMKYELPRAKARLEELKAKSPKTGGRRHTRKRKTKKYNR